MYFSPQREVPRRRQVQDEAQRRVQLLEEGWHVQVWRQVHFSASRPWARSGRPERLPRNGWESKELGIKLGEDKVSASQKLEVLYSRLYGDDFNEERDLRRYPQRDLELCHPEREHDAHQVARLRNGLCSTEPQVPA